MSFFYYCFYRISSAYKYLDSKDYHIYGGVIVSGCQAFNLLSILSIVFYLLGLKQSKLIIVFVIISFCILNLFILDKKKYAELNERWKSESNKMVRGYFVLAYIVISILTYFMMLFGLNI